MAIVQNSQKSKWLWVAVSLLVILAAIWVVRISGSDRTVQAAQAITQTSDVAFEPAGLASWVGVDGVLDQAAILRQPASSGAFSVRLASELVPPGSRWTATSNGGVMTAESSLVMKVTAVTKDLDERGLLTMDAQSDGPVSRDEQVQLSSHPQEDSGGVAMSMTAIVVASVP